MNMALATLIFVAAITPGPNNFIVLQLALAQGWRAAARAMIGILLGSLIMLTMAQLGVSPLFERSRVLRIAVLATGCAYLVWLGVRMLRNSFRQDAAPSALHGVLALCLFQFVNGKAWILMLTVSAAAQSSPSDLGPAALYLSFIAISAACLSVWAAGGRWAETALRDAKLRQRFDRSLAVALIALAAWLPFH